MARTYKVVEMENYRLEDAIAAALAKTSKWKRMYVVIFGEVITAVCATMPGAKTYLGNRPGGKIYRFDPATRTLIETF